MFGTWGLAGRQSPSKADCTWSSITEMLALRQAFQGQRAVHCYTFLTRVDCVLQAMSQPRSLLFSFSFHCTIVFSLFPYITYCTSLPSSPPHSCLLATPTLSFLFLLLCISPPLPLSPLSSLLPLLSSSLLSPLSLLSLALFELLWNLDISCKFQVFEFYVLLSHL